MCILPSYSHNLQVKLQLQVALFLIWRKESQFTGKPCHWILVTFLHCKLMTCVSMHEILKDIGCIRQISYYTYGKAYYSERRFLNWKGGKISELAGKQLSQKSIIFSKSLHLMTMTDKFSDVLMNISQQFIYYTACWSQECKRKSDRKLPFSKVDNSI